MWTPEINQMLNDIVEIDQYDEKRKLACVCIVERMLVLREQALRGEQDVSAPKGMPKNNFGPGKWNQRKTRYDSSCGNCGEFLSGGTLCWITVGDSPRCLEHGRPDEGQ